MLLSSDAGMPTISDPGYIAAAVASQKPICPLPWCSALQRRWTALALSGLPTGRFTFEGFLARKGPGAAASHRWRGRSVPWSSTNPLIVTAATLADFVQTFGGDRRGTVSRELIQAPRRSPTRYPWLSLPIGPNENASVAKSLLLSRVHKPPKPPEAQDEVQLVLGRVAGGERLKSSLRRGRR